MKDKKELSEQFMDWADMTWNSEGKEDWAYIIMLRGFWSRWRSISHLLSIFHSLQKTAPEGQ